MPRILAALDEHVPFATRHHGQYDSDPEGPAQQFPRFLPNITDRVWNGGMPSHRPEKWIISTLGSEPASCRAIAARKTGWICLASFLIVFQGTISAWILSALVPPEGMGCRQFAESFMILIWIASFSIQYLIAKLAARKKDKTWAWRLVFLKDLAMSLGIIAVILVTQWGYLNRSGTSSGLKPTRPPKITPKINRPC